MRKITKYISIILLSIMLFFMNITPIFAATANITITSSNSKVVVGNTFTVKIKVKSSS